MALATLARSSGLLRCARPSIAARVSRASSARFMASAAAAPTYKLLEYKYVPDILEKRGPYRADHLAGAQKKADEGKLILAGAAGDPVEGALFVFKNTSKEEIEAFIKDDPYVVNGLVPSWSIKPYMVVVGGN